MAVCLLAAGALVVALPANAFTLSWTHSVEKTAWREMWRVEDGRLILEGAEVSASGAGMEPPEGAVLRDGAWHYRPALPPQRRVRLAHSEFAGDYAVCWRSACVPLSSLAARGGDSGIEIVACAGGGGNAAPAAGNASGADSRQGKVRQ